MAGPPPAGARPPRGARGAGPGGGRARGGAPSEPMPATIGWLGEEVRVELDEPAHGIAPGQAVVYYDGERVVGSSTIARAA